MDVRRARLCVALVCAVALLGACGKKGKLYLPEEAASPAPAAALPTQVSRGRA